MFFNLFKKKEKPISVEGLMQVGEKSLLTDDYSYMITNITTYESRIDICFDLVDNHNNKLKNVTVSVSLDGDERLIPFEVEGKTLYWDRTDRSLRLRYMPEGEPTALIPKVLFYPNDVMTMEQEYAEKYYTKEALSYAVIKDGVYIWCYLDGSASPVVFETPRLFSLFDNSKMHPLSSAIPSIRSYLGIFTPGYLEAMGITDDNFIQLYGKNFEVGK